MTDATDLAERAGDRDPRVGLRAVAALRRLLGRLEAVQVRSARAQGWSWQDPVADLLTEHEIDYLPARRALAEPKAS